MNCSINDHPTSRYFKDACRSVLTTVEQYMDFDLWAITERVDDKWVLLHTNSNSYNIEDGATFNWDDTVCARMVKNLGPRIAPDVASIQAYKDAPILQQAPIGAYLGVPIMLSDGSLFGTFCAADPAVKPASITEHLPMIETCAELLGGIVEMETQSIKQAQELKSSQQIAYSDSLTGIQNRRGWDATILSESERNQHYGGELSVFILDLDELKKTNDANGHAAGDALLIKTANCLQTTIRKSDVAARIGGDEFGVLAVDCDYPDASVLHVKLNTALLEAGIRASIGHATKNLDENLSAAVKRADKMMYREKAIHKYQLTNSFD